MRLRFWIETALTSLTGALLVVTLFWREWIEIIFDVDPDHGSGSAELATVVAIAALTIGLGVAARSEWQRPARLARAS